MLLCGPFHLSPLQGSCHLCFPLSPFYHSQKITHISLSLTNKYIQEAWSWRSRFLLFFTPCDRRRRQVSRHHSSQIFYVPMMHHVSVALLDALCTVAVRGEKMALNLGNRGRALQFMAWHKFLWPPADLLAGPRSFLAPPCMLHEKQHLTKLKLTLTQKWVVGVKSRRRQ